MRTLDDSIVSDSTCSDVRNGRLLHVVGNVEILELGIPLGRRAEADDQWVAGEVDDGIGDERRFLRLFGLGIGCVAGDLGFTARACP